MLMCIRYRVGQCYMDVLKFQRYCNIIIWFFIVIHSEKKTKMKLSNALYIDNIGQKDSPKFI